MNLLMVARPFAFHGGVETATAGMLTALVERGHDVHVLSPGAQAPIRGLTVHRLRVPPLPRTLRMLAIPALVRSALARGRWDTVQSHERTLGQDLYRAGEGCHQGYLDSRETRTSSRAVYHRIVVALEHRIFTRTPIILAIARQGKSEIERRYPIESDRVLVVYNGVDLERFHPGNRVKHRSPARAEVGLPVGARLLLFVGTGFERKGLRTAIEAVAALDDRSARLLVVGRGDVVTYRALARRLGVDDRIVWLDPQRRIERWYAAADVLVLPARYEPFGNVHLEALASGLPVVTSTRSGGAEIVTEAITGAIRDPDDGKGVAEGVRLMLDRPAQETVDACRRAAEPYTFRRQAETLEDIYRRVARKP